MHKFLVGEKKLKLLKQISRNNAVRFRYGPEGDWNVDRNYTNLHNICAELHTKLDEQVFRFHSLDNSKYPIQNEL